MIRNRAHFQQSRDPNSLLDSSQSAKFFHDFSRISVHAKKVPGMAGPESEGTLSTPEEPPGEFNEEEMEGSPAPPSAAEEATVATGTETATTPEAAGVVTPARAPSATKTVIRGPREMWYFDGETPPSYTVSSRLSTNRTGGTFSWSVSPHLTLSSATAATPTVTTAAPSVPPGRDAWIRVRHTDTAAASTVASYRLTILAPESLTHLRDVDSPHATWVYESRIHYSISDQFGTTLPRNVPINEQWTGGIVADFAGMNWRRGAEGSATVNPADWNDWIGGENVAFAAVPAPVTSTHADAAVAVYHWPGDWRVGSLTIGSGRRVSSVTWQKNRGFARHT
jgi:hypothetical protein